MSRRNQLNPDQGALWPTAAPQPAAAEPEPAGPSARDVVAAYVTAVRAAGMSPQKNRVGRIARDAKRLLADGFGFDLLRNAATVLGATPWDDLARQAQIMQNGKGPRRSTTDERVGAALDLANAARRREEAAALAGHPVRAVGR